MDGPFFGVKSKKIVHDLNKMRPECNALEIKKSDRKYFTPDTLIQAKKEGYNECKICFEK